jgi:biotin transport system substrate-specific component
MRAETSSNPILIDTLWPARSTIPWLRAGALAIAGVVLLTLSAKLKVPFYPVPMTMQSFTVLVIGVAYGWRLAGTTLLFYLFAGAVGLPVFAGTPEKGVGLAYMLGPTGGYLLGFLAAAMLMGFLAERGWGRNGALLCVAMLIGHAVLFAPGVFWLAQHIGFSRAWALGVTPFYLATLLKSALGAAIVRGAWAKYGRA